jgi:hypothetical protein
MKVLYRFHGPQSMEFARFHGTGRIPWKRLFHESAVTDQAGLELLVYGPNASQVFLILGAQAKVVVKTGAQAVGQLTIVFRLLFCYFSSRSITRSLLAILT